MPIDLIDDGQRFCKSEFEQHRFECALGHHKWKDINTVANTEDSDRHGYAVDGQKGKRFTIQQCIYCKIIRQS